MVNSIVWLIVGAIIGGGIALVIHRRRSILWINIAVGSIGAFIAGYIISPIFHVKTTSFSWPGLLIAVVGTIVLLAVFNFFVREHTVTDKVINSQWAQVQYKIHTRWSKISEEEAVQIKGNHDQLIGLIAERYEITKGEAEVQLQSYLKAVTNE
jgi:uncharacterized membrane protein YeaQ/YmgE (transglycosylase-associated protein family)/uncharacterized protein YjbJ (UPF0337 family)